MVESLGEYLSMGVLLAQEAVWAAMSKKCVCSGVSVRSDREYPLAGMLFLLLQTQTLLCVFIGFARSTALRYFYTTGQDR